MGDDSSHWVPVPVDDYYLTQIVHVMRDIVVVTESEPLDEPGPRIVYVNRAFTELTGYTTQEVLGKSPRILQRQGETDEATTLSIRASLESRSPFQGLLLNFGKDQQPYWLELSIFPLHDRDGNVKYFAAIERDSTERTQRELEMRERASKDQLTGTLNRHGFEQLVVPSWSTQAGTRVAVAAIDVDDFKSINDEAGHASGDEVLSALGELLLSEVRTTDFVVRMGGDEFSLFLFGASMETATAVAERIRTEALSRLGQTLSIGVAARQNGSASDAQLQALIADSDAALLRAKSHGGNRVIAASPADARDSGLPSASDDS